MSRRGRKRKEGQRRPSGRLSEAANARPDESKPILQQPHRAPFARLLGPDAAGDFLCGFALGRLRLFGQAEEQRVKEGKLLVHHVGITEAEFQAGQTYAMVVGRERFARGTPKDKPAALDFLQARGLSLSGVEMSPAERQRAVADFEDARAVIAAAPLPVDVRKVHNSIVQLLRLQRGRSEISEKLARYCRTLPGLVHPVASDAVLRNVNAVVIDDRDPVPLARSVLIVERGLRWSSEPVMNDANQRAFALVAAVRRGLTALAGYYGIDRRGKPKRPDGVTTSFVKERPSWREDMHETVAVEPEEPATPTAVKPDRDHPFR